MFHTLVNKLAQICDFEPKGNTVTALAVIWRDGRICYVFASNRRRTPALKNARIGLKAFLDILKSNLEAETRDSDEVMERRLLGEILSRNNVRVRSYLTALAKELSTCIKKCDAAGVEGMEARDAMTRLAQMLPDPNKDGQKGDNYINSMIRFIEAIRENSTSPLRRYISARAAEDDKMAKGGSWSTVRHVSGRLVAYQYAAQTPVQAHHIWADTELFRDFNIASVRSSQSYPAEALNLNPMTTEAIMHRAPGCTQAQVDAYKQHAAALQQYLLDSKLERQWKTRALDPIVHAEMLLHDWLARTEGGIQAYRFFHNWRYIGTSKPVCRLCQEYFHVIATPVRFRSGHPNTYLNWRLPDMYYVGGEDSAITTSSIERARRDWCEILGRMKGRVYAAVVQVLEEKVSDKKAHDSNTYTDKVSGVKEMDRLAGWLEHVQLG
ncbi:hypothetical protein C8A00DRAFT_29719 [Chaetomidium leptoderma]|uniref:Uncharacterized protein n=1 Tax=Chaetomidium leptoderma TaxID=669021 RepID=A0AAN6VTY2_9PEZI|nr:hypothetical protein C8A00DRAFT_29719 [Chaetomidium leptoderma]